MSRSGGRALRWAGASLLVVAVGVVAGRGDDGRDGPWRATFESSDGEVLARWDPDVRAHWGRRAPQPGWAPDDFSFRFETCVLASSPGHHRVVLGGDDAVTLRVGGRNLVEQAGASHYREWVRDVELGDAVQAVVVEGRDISGASSVQLWLERDEERMPLPARWLSRPPCGG